MKIQKSFVIVNNNYFIDKIVHCRAESCLQFRRSGFSELYLIRTHQSEVPPQEETSSSQNLDGIELICGTGCAKERSEQILRTGWADPVHPKQHIYSKMALNLIERVAAANNTPTSQKRKRSESSEDASSSRGRQERTGRGSGHRGGHFTHSSHPANTANTVNTAPGSSRSVRGFFNNNYSWTPPPSRGRGSNPGRGDARGRGYAGERGHGNNYRGGQPRGGWGRPWSRW
jgi:hypothetical protein